MDDATLIYYRTGVRNEPVVEFLVDLLAHQAKSPGVPLLSWLEPAPRPASEASLGPVKECKVLSKGFSKPDHPLDEARLFWDNKAIQVVSGPGAGCRFFEYSDDEFPECAERKIRRVSGQQGDDILIRLDWERFGLQPSGIKKVKVVKYLDGVDLFAWRLIPGD